MNVRNFWMEADIDGRQTRLTGGPRAKDGNMDITVYMRSDGSPVKVCYVECFAMLDNRLRLRVIDPQTGEVAIEYVTQR